MSTSKVLFVFVCLCIFFERGHSSTHFRGNPSCFFLKSWGENQILIFYVDSLKVNGLPLHVAQHAHHDSRKSIIFLFFNVAWKMNDLLLYNNYHYKSVCYLSTMDKSMHSKVRLLISQNPGWAIDCNSYKGSTNYRSLCFIYIDMPSDNIEDFTHLLHIDARMDLAIVSNQRFSFKSTSKTLSGQILLL